MSNRLLSMKFMQRASAAAPPSTPEGPPSKRQRTSLVGTATPTTPSTPIQTPEDAKRQAVLDRQAEEAGETKWVLSVAEAGKPKGKGKAAAVEQRALRVVAAGWSAIDSPVAATAADWESEEASSADETAHSRAAPRPQVQGRRSFGKFNKTLERQQDPNYVSSSSSSSDSDSEAEGEGEGDGEGDDDDDDEREDGQLDYDDGAHHMMQAARRDAAKAKLAAKKKADKAELDRLGAERRKKGVNLNKASNEDDSPRSAVKTCFKCGWKGHQARDCPTKANNDTNSRADRIGGDALPKQAARRKREWN